jgi:hypothetical protein
MPTSMQAATASMTAVEIHPRTHCGLGNFKTPVIVLFVVINMTRTMMGFRQACVNQKP